MKTNQFIENKKNYYGENINLIYHDGSSYIGVYHSYTTAVDNDPDGESITLLMPDGGQTEYFTDEIKEILLA